MKPIGTIWGFVIGWVFMLLILMLFVQTQYYWGANKIVRQRLEVKEPFQMPTKVEDSPEDLSGKGSLSPNDASLDRPRQPYTLLNGWIEGKTREEMSEEVGAGALPPGVASTIPDSVYGQTVNDIYKEAGVLPRPAFSAQTCYESDFQTRLEKTGNFRQMTNNYRRGNPDSCSAPNQEVALGFYKIDAVPFDVNCLSKKQWPLETLKA